jgi:site-specific DNA-methyltransferase (adenine-specific)
MKVKDNYNPDVLSCLANLSSDEVFTSPKLANEILDLLPKEIWRDKNAAFLDPVSKSGVFLREIAKRLLDGLKSEMPDDQKRIDHIYKNQIFGIGITELTSLLSRRSLYCSKTANGKYSVADVFDNEQGNIFFDATAHDWKNGKCSFCGASQSEYEREEGLETHAYQFIHNNLPDKIKNMKFDVIIGNPPYQLGDGGGTGSSAMPIYQKFVEQAKKLSSRYLVMITPSRWFSGGRGLDEFRNDMLSDDRIRVIHDYTNASDCFPGVEIKGGVSYFLWDRDNRGKCRIFTHDEGKVLESERELLEKGASTFIRHNHAIPILRKVQSFKEENFSSIISPNDPFGFDVRVENSYKRVKPNFKLKPFQDSVLFYYNGWKKEGVGYIGKSSIKKNTAWIDKYKVLIPKAWGVGNTRTDWINPFLVGSNSCCTETYLVIGPFNKEKVAENVISYTQTKFFHMMLSLVKITQNTMKNAYVFVPMQDFSEQWTDEKLYKKYKLAKEEIDFIESMIRPMN